jgi:hypothetical protein
MAVAPLLKEDFRALLESVLLDDDAIIDTSRPWTLEGLLACDADAADPDGESDQEVDGSAIVLNFVPPRRTNSGSERSIPKEPQDAA